MDTLTNSRTHSDMIRIVAMLLCCMMCCSIFLMTNAQVAFCADVTDTLGDAAETVAGKFYSTALKFVVPVVIICIIIAAFFIIGGGKGTEKARQIGIGIAFFVILIIFAPLIAREIGNMFVDQVAGDISQYNPLG